MVAPTGSATRERRSGGAVTDSLLLWKRQVTRYFNNPLKILSLLIRPLIWLGLFGVAMGTVVREVAGFSYAIYILPGIVTMAVLASASRGGQTILRDKNMGFLKEVLVAPVSRTSILMGFCMGITTRSLVNALLMVIAGLFLGASLGATPVAIVVNVISLILILSVLSFALVSLSIALAWKIDDIVTYSTLSGWVFLPLFFLSGGLYKVSGLPPILKTLIALNPLTYGVDAVRQIMLGTRVGAFDYWVDLAVVGAFALVSLGFAMWVLRRNAVTE
jgi:ABC-2 type transport system permease protein